MISLSPVSSLLPAPIDSHFKLLPSQTEPTSQQSKVASSRDFVDPPEMSEAVKAEALKGRWCYYGFYFPDVVAKAIDKERGIDCPSGSNPRDWMEMRKTKILNEASSNLGIRFSTCLALQDDDQEDVVFFAYLKKTKFYKSRCLPVDTIKELMAALGIEDEPQWIVA